MTLLSHIFNAACGPLLAVLGTALFLNAMKDRSPGNANSRIRTQTLGLFVCATSFVSVALCTKLLLRVINNSTDSSILIFEWTLIAISSIAWVLGFLYFPRFFKTRRAVRYLVFSTASVAILAVVFRDHQLTVSDAFLLAATAVWIAVSVVSERKRILRRQGQERVTDR
ncbi:MAG: hypothetical protein Q7Q73_08660 [Verrucomicrobiota bacterium JB024]|nr:hypothetical protein [Verrucomicrobiota bacterium JB024]